MDEDGRSLSEIKKSVKKGECLITIKGEFTIGYTDELLKLVNINLDKLSKIQINARNVSKIDISGIQTILFLIRKVRNLRLEFDYISPEEDEVCNLLKQCGFDSLVK